MSLAIVEQFFEGGYRTESCPSERAYYDLWHARGLGDMPPTDCAIAGGLLADRLPWVFAAGYQATLHNAFPGLAPRGWAAFAATEDTRDPVAHPPVSLAVNGLESTLNGCKSWVAHSRLVDHLIVTINDPAGDKRAARGVIVDRDRDGVVLSHRENPGFLAALSQGFACFERTPIDGGSVFTFEPIRQFGRTEAKFIMLAACAFLLAHTDHDTPLQDSLAALAASLLALLAETETSRQAYAAIDREFQRCVDRFETGAAPGRIPDYAADRRLFRMYTERIQRRQAYAQAEAAGRSS